jgi:hypothetical protein
MENGLENTLFIGAIVVVVQFGGEFVLVILVHGLDHRQEQQIVQLRVLQLQI